MLGVVLQEFLKKRQEILFEAADGGLKQYCVDPDAHRQGS
jgi:hypothetical protein